jgi:hypothetical protein
MKAAASTTVQKMHLAYWEGTGIALQRELAKDTAEKQSPFLARREAFNGLAQDKSQQYHRRLD